MSDEKEKVIQYIENSISVLNLLKSDVETINKIFQIIKDGRKNNHRIFLMGNGGSSSTATHFVCDLNKTSRTEGIKHSQAFALNDNIPSVFAISNDLGFEKVFEEQLKNFLQKNDIVIAISASGKSENIIKAVQYAKNTGAIIIGLTGFDGGKLKEYCVECLIVKSDKMYHIEDIHLIINHIITYLFTGYSYR